MMAMVDDIDKVEWPTAKHGPKGADDDEEIEIDLDDVTSYVAKKAQKEGMGDFDPEDLLFVIQGDFEFNDPEDDDDE